MIITKVILLSKPKFVTLAGALCNQTPRILWSAGWSSELIQNLKKANSVLFYEGLQILRIKKKPELIK